MEGDSSVPNGTSDRDLADSIARRLATILTNGISISFADKILWKDIPRTLAERGFYLSGVPSMCAPIVRDDVVQDDYHMWSHDQLQVMHSALQRDILRIKFRNPVCPLPRFPLNARADAIPAHSVIFELDEGDGTMKDSTLGFSALWRHNHMFPESAYGSVSL